jgi:hypothetical protein
MHCQTFTCRGLRESGRRNSQRVLDVLARAWYHAGDHPDSAVTVYGVFAFTFRFGLTARRSQLHHFFGRRCGRAAEQREVWKTGDLPDD